ncbi:hypothetical protein [Sphingobacterium sp.]|uniref:SLOG domain-containing protein n=1 Tax=Sphingobacterium sp. TaxID=341027 RepID=UPI0028AD8894|nr:hypothetical protein [Sphingobacterium sp.]
MAEKKLNKIFLSASIPLQDRDPKFYRTADIVAIRDAVKALATVVIPNSILIWGGHPSITPLIRFVMDKMGSDVKKHVTIYQSNFFKDHFIEDNLAFENIKIIDKNIDRDSSLLDMRNAMIIENEFKAGIFIGGMQGVEEEFLMFKNAHPSALLLPIASTGAAARIIYDDQVPNLDIKLKKEYAYMSLFKSMLKNILNNG